MQLTFFDQVKALTNVIEEMGNPFFEESDELLVLDTRDIADPLVVEAMYVLKKTGQVQYNTFITERLVQQTKPINDPIKRNNFPLFSRPPVREKSKSKQQLLSLKNDCSLFSSLYISCQRRDGDLDDFLKHENQACPPSLSSMGKLRLGTKSDIVSCLENLIDIDEVSNPKVDAVILDGAAIVNMLRPGTADTFSEYASKIFLPYITKQLQVVQRLDVVWDEYVQSSLKAYTRSTRGKGCRRRVESSNTVPKNWLEFLRNEDNKRELFSFLSLKTASVSTESTQIIVTHHQDVLCTSPRMTTSLAPCTQEEADTRMFLHVSDAVNHGHSKVMIRTVDSDVLVLAIAAVQQLIVDELWIAFSSGKSFRYLPAPEIAHALGPENCIALPFTGFHTGFAFRGGGNLGLYETVLIF